MPPLPFETERGVLAPLSSEQATPIPRLFPAGKSRLRKNGG